MYNADLFDLITIDTKHLGHPNVIAAHLLLSHNAALVDPGPASTLDTLEQSLRVREIAINDIEYILLTHIHLDHAGSTGLLLQRYPHLKVYVHERGAAHLIDPSRLLNSAQQLYGTRMHELWGDVLPVPAEAITVLKGGESIDLGDREVKVYDAPGHAKHHVVYHDQESGIAFVGDVCGVRIPGFNYERPATPPPDIDLEAWDATLEHLIRVRPEAIALTHFGPFTDVERHLNDYRYRLHEWASIVRTGLLSGAPEREQIAALRAYAEAELAEMGSYAVSLHTAASPADQSWRGLARYWTKKLGV